MSKKIQIASIMVAAIFIIAACETAPTSQTNLNPPLANQTNDLSNGLQIMDPGSVEEGVSRTPIIANLSDADSVAYDGAISLNDSSFCDKINDQSFKDLCKSDLADSAILNKAIMNMDKTLCQEMSSEDQVAVCEVKVDIEMRSKEMAEQKAAQNTADMASLDDAVNSAELANCAKLDEIYIPSCELDVLLNKAFAEKNPALCEQASTAIIVTTCKDRYEASKEQNDEEQV